MSRESKETFLQRRHPNGQEVHEKMLNRTNHQGNANQNLHEISPHPCQKGYQRRTQITNVGKDVEEKEPFYIVGEKVNWCSH